MSFGDGAWTALSFSCVSLVQTLRQVQQDYEKRVHDVEQQREYLVKEMELREDELLGKVGQLEEERRQLERRLKKCSTDRDHMSDVNSILSTENDRWGMAQFSNSRWM